MPTEKIKAHKSSNSLHSFLLIAAMTGVLGLIGFVMFGKWGSAIAIGLGVLGLLLSPRVSPRLVLRLYRARPILPSQAPDLAQVFYQLSRRANLDPLPGLFYVPTKLPNAFAVGHDKSAAIAVTDGLLRTMNPRELKGILAHELSHLWHRDTYVMGIADTIARMTSLLSRIGLIMMLFSFAAGDDLLWYFLRGLLLFFAPTVTVLLQLALSRAREFNADMGAVELTGDPYGLASALDKLERVMRPQSIWRKIFVPGYQQSQPALLRTHPETEERVKRLLELAQAMHIPPPGAAPGRPRHAPPVRDRDSNRRISVGFDDRVRARPRYHIMSGIFR